MQTGHDAGSQLEERFKIPASVDHSENEYALAFDRIDNHVLAHGKTAHSSATIQVTGSSCIRETGQKKKLTGNGIQQPVATSRLPLSLAT
jgi:hypothetical protein